MDSIRSIENSISCHKQMGDAISISINNFIWDSVREMVWYSIWRIFTRNGVAANSITTSVESKVDYYEFK